MKKFLEVFEIVFKKVCIGCVYLSIFDSVMVFYYGIFMSLKQVVNVIIEDGRILVISVWEWYLIFDIEKVIMKVDLGLNLSSNGDFICVLMLLLIE